MLTVSAKRRMIQTGGSLNVPIRLQLLYRFMEDIFVTYILSAKSEELNHKKN